MYAGDYEKIIFKEKGEDELRIGYFYTHQNMLDSFYKDPDEGKRFFTYGRLDYLGCDHRINAEDADNIKTDWWICISEIDNKIAEEENFINEMISICLCDQKKFEPILSLLKKRKKLKFCDTCKNRKKCDPSEEWECTKYYPPRYYEEGDPEPEGPVYGNRTDSQLLSFISRTGRLPRTEEELRNSIRNEHLRR